MAGIVKLIGYAIAFVIVVGIVLVVLDANEDSAIVEGWLDVARFFTDPFRDIFDLEKGKEDEQIAINWGIAAVVYLVVTAIIARLLGRVRRPRRLGRRDRD